MAAVTFAVPGGLEQPTGGYAYDRRVLGCGSAAARST